MKTVIRNININTVSYFDISFEIKNNKLNIYVNKNKESILNYDTFIFRAFVRKLDFFKEIISQYLIHNHKNILNKNIIPYSSCYVNKLR